MTKWFIAKSFIFNPLPFWTHINISFVLCRRSGSWGRVQGPRNLPPPLLRWSLFLRIRNLITSPAVTPFLSDTPSPKKKSGSSPALWSRRIRASGCVREYCPKHYQAIADWGWQEGEVVAERFWKVNVQIDEEFSSSKVKTKQTTDHAKCRRPRISLKSQYQTKIQKKTDTA